MPRQLSNIQKLRIIIKIGTGWSIKSIFAEFNLSKTTVHRIKKLWENEESIERKRGTGRQIITTVEQDADLVDYLGHRPFETAKKASVETNFPASVTTTLRRIWKTDLRS